MSKATPNKNKPAKKIAPARRTPIPVEVNVRDRREKLIASKRLAGLSPELAESTADRQIELDKGIVRSPFATDLDREEAIATEGVKTNASQIPRNPNPEDPDLAVKIKTEGTALTPAKD